MTQQLESIWDHKEDGSTFYVFKEKSGYYGHNNKFDFSRKTKKETYEQLKKWDYEKIERS